MRGVDLFSGIGGISLALADVVEPMIFCEPDKFCRGVLEKNFGASATHETWPILLDDVRRDDYKAFDMEGERVDIIYGGFPCQDISASGKGRGVGEGTRSGLVFDALRWVEHFQPTFVFFENVQGIRHRGLRQILVRLDELGYNCQWGVLSAHDVGAWHHRERWFLLARRREGAISDEPHAEVHAYHQDTNAFSVKNAPRVVVEKANVRDSVSAAYAPPSVKAYGNGVVPQQVVRAFAVLCGFRGSERCPPEEMLRRSCRGTDCVVDVLRENVLDYRHGKCLGLLHQPDTLSLPAYGAMVVGEDARVYEHVPWRRATPREMLWPTPTHCQRPNAGHVRAMRRLVLLGYLSWFEGYIWCYGKCPCSEMSTVRRWEFADTAAHREVHRALPRNFGECAFKRNPEFFAWLMGYPLDWC